MEFDVFVLLGRSTESGEYTPIGCGESYSMMEKVQAETADTLRLSAFTMTAENKAKIEGAIASMAIVPARLILDV